jgi:hypothetical protein
MQQFIRSVVLAGTLGTLSAVPLTAQSVSKKRKSRAAAVSALDTRSQPHRTSDIVRELADALPGSVRLLDGQQAWTLHLTLPPGELDNLKRFRFSGQPKEVAAAESGYWSRTNLSTVEYMDTLISVWRSTSPRVHADWLFAEDGGMFDFTLVPSLAELTSTTAHHAAIQQFATIALETAQRTPNVPVAERLTAAGHLLNGFLALARADTAHAIRELLVTARLPHPRINATAVRTLYDIVQFRGPETDTTRLQIMALYQLLARDVPGSAQVDASHRLRSGYAKYVESANRTPPDVVPKGERHMAAVSGILSLDAYLDRQWVLLFDREFVVAQVVPAQPARSGRLTVVEYVTGQGCSGCWSEDMGLQPLERRYDASEVVTLAWHGHPPLVAREGRHNWWKHIGRWYPSRYDTQTPSTIPFATLLKATGDTLSGRTVVNGHPIESASRPWTYTPQETYYCPTIDLIDRERTRAPEIVLGLDVRTVHDSVHVRVNMDSLRSTSRKLALRIALVVDTVWKRGGNPRRIYTNVVQDAAHDDSLSLGLSLGGALPTTVSYSFDLAAIQAARTQDRDEPFVADSTNLADVYWGMTFPDPRDWHLDRTRLFVVAFVQDLETGNVLQAARMKVPVVAVARR